MRVIEFRGKAKNKTDCNCAEDNGFVYGGIAFDDFTGKTYITRWNSFGLGFIENIEVDPATVGQFTGLTDKNGELIYEGDLVNIPGSSRQGLPGEVHWYGLSCMFSIRRKGYNPVLLDGDTVYEVVGNIYDNPDMLK